MKSFYSHITKIYDEKREQQIGSKIKFLRDHIIRGVLSITLTNFFQTPFTKNVKETLELAVKLHDLGKYTLYFQDYLKTDKKPLDDLHTHSYIGSCTAFNILKSEDVTLALYAYFIILNHHGNLGDITKCYKDDSDAYYNKLKRQTKAQQNNLSQKLQSIKEGLNIDIRDNLPYEPLDLFQEVFLITTKNLSIQHYYLITYLFSLLIEADKLDASETPVYTKVAIPIESVNNAIKKKTKSDTSALRNNIRKTVLQKLELPDILQQKIFTLTAPTGIGKTLTALDFAIKLREKIGQTEGYLPQIIYALPFINIIEQGLEEYQKTLPTEVKILAHYQYADVFGDHERQDEEQEESDYYKRLMQLDTWQSDVVITSFVQFFQTLIGNRNKILKKFNHLAGAIVILDEVQTLRLDQIPLIGVSLYYLSKFLGTRILLMTATKPKILN